MQIIVSIEWVTGVDWPEPFASCSRLMSISQLNLPEIIPVGCAIHNITFYDQVFSATIIPIALVTLMHLASLKRLALISRGRAIYWSQVVAFYVLPSTSLVLFRMFDCKVSLSLHVSITIVLTTNSTFPPPLTLPLCEQE